VSVTAGGGDAGDLVARFRSHLASAGLKYTRQRRVVAVAFFGVAGHHSLGELHTLASAQLPGLGFATVYRTMKLLVDCGLAAEHKFAESGHVRFERVVDGAHHDHLICVDCGHILEFEDDRIEQMQDAVALARGFKVVSHRHEIYGSCVAVDCPRRDPEARRAGEHIGVPSGERRGQ
jgi:Fur family ferric uptake transcriptional regulator